MKEIFIAVGGVLMGAIWMLGYVSNVASHPRDNCECLELRAIRRILEQQFNVACDERRCLPVPTPTGTPDGGKLP